MRYEIVKRLLSLNQEFYSRFAGPFANSRSNPQPGYLRLLENLPPGCERVLDIGCGNGRYGYFLKIHQPVIDYTGIDFTSELLNLASKRVRGRFYQRDISRIGFLNKLGEFDIVVCLSTMQHVPGRSNRLSLLREMKSHLNENGRIILANWQFMDSQRQRRKIRDWAQLDLSEADLEAGDYLLSWQREGRGLRYVCLIDTKATALLTREAGLNVTTQFRSDGKEGDLNLYTVFEQTA